MAVTIKNSWYRTLLVNIKGKKEPLRLMPRGTVDVGEKEMESPELKNLIASGDIRVFSAARTKEVMGKPTKVAEKPKTGKEKKD